MNSPARILLIGYHDQDNLGLRYLASRLQQDGHQTRLATFAVDPAPVLELVRAWRPDVVGFSLIFQFMAPRFGEVIAALRRAGVQAHLTMGGHYPSFEPEALFRRIPQLDSIVRFEGEDTLAGLVARLAGHGGDWRAQPGIAWMDGDRVVCNPAGPARTDLDTLPWPDRADIPYAAQALPTASVLASRGCPWRCSFCSIITFYEQNGTRGRRRRDPAHVLDELEHLARDRGVRLILFQDDDFLAGGRQARDWALAIAAGLVSRGLHDVLRLKLSCRSDEVRADVLGPMVDAGLAHVYLGVESGDPDSLVALDKRLSPDVHLRAGETLRALGLSFDFGFQLLQPWSTLDSVTTNVAFLRELAAGGWTAAGFCRTLPYVGTPVESRLRAEGRLVGDSLQADYRFLDPRLDALWDFCLVAFEGRNHGPRNTWDSLRSMLFDARLSWPEQPCEPAFLAAVQALADASNGVMLDVVEAAVELLADGDATVADDTPLVELARLARREDAALRRDLWALREVRPRSAPGRLFA